MTHPLIYVGGVLLSLGGAVVHYFWGRKAIAILGPRESGKTTLYTFLSQDKVPIEYEATTGKARTKRNTVCLADLKLKLWQGFDVAGADIDAATIWEAEVRKSDIVLYLVRADLAASSDGEYYQRVVRDVKMIKPWLTDKQKVFLVGTFADKDSEATTGVYDDRFRAYKVFQDARLHLGIGVRATAGSLKTADSARRLVLQLLQLGVAE